MKPTRIRQEAPYKSVRGSCSASKSLSLIKAHGRSYDVPINASDIISFRVVCNGRKG